MSNWQKDIIEFCEHYNVPIDYLAQVLYEPKVVPMIRGKAFEFTVMLALQKYLPSDRYKVEKISMNAQFGSHDEDVTVIHLESGKTISVECKLAGKGMFQFVNKQGYKMRVKCMRSRTTSSDNVLARRSESTGISVALHAVHSDSYTPKDFHVVVTTIGNAFYQTDNKSELFEWEPSVEGKKFLEMLQGGSSKGLQHFAFNQLYAAPTMDLAPLSSNNIVCNRIKCTHKTNCGFIPNYPQIWFKPSMTGVEVQRPWELVDTSIATLFDKIASQI